MFVSWNHCMSFIKFAVAHLVYPNHLHRVVWLALQRYTVKDETQPDCKLLKLTNKLKTKHP